MLLRSKVAAILVVTYLITRLVNLSALPIFNDEAFFIVTARKIIADPAANFFINFIDGKEPLSFWFFIVPTALFSDQLLGGRLFSVLLGLLTLGLVYRLGGIWAGLGFVFSPFLLVTERLAVQENLLIFLLTLALYFKNSWRFAIFIGLALFTKTTAILYSLALLTRKNLLAFCLAILIYLPILATSVFTHNAGYAGLGANFLTNLKQAGRWLIEYQGWPLVLLAFFSPFILKTPTRWVWWLLAFGPILVEAAIAKIFFPRYFVFSIVPIVLLAGKVIERYKLAVLVLIPNLWLSWQIVSDIRTAQIPYIEKWQYVEAWPAGYGVKETAEYLKKLNPSLVIAEDIMILTSGLQYYWPQVKIVPYKDQTEGTFVFKRSKEPAVSEKLENIYNSYDVSVYRSRDTAQ